jgi:FkbM family methyltransferase
MKSIINKILLPFNAEIHGKGYLQQLANNDFSKDPFIFQHNFFLKKKVNQIFDIGANTGITVERYHQLFPNAKIHAFEPFPASYQVLNKKFQDNSSIAMNQLGVFKTKGSLDFFVNQNVDTNSLFQPIKSGLSSDNQTINIGKIFIDTISLDEYCNSNEIKKIEILKMDIQGGELDALIGAINLIKTKSIDLIYCEAFFIRQYLKQPLFYDIATYLDSNGYSLQDIYSPFYGNGSLAWCDAIFLPRLK